MVRAMIDSERFRLMAIFAVTVAVRLVFHRLTGFLFDDAFITFRYAENIAAGHGFVYNLGERVLGTTTPLFTLMLAALSRIGVSPLDAALWISLISAGFTGILVYQLAKSWRLGRFVFFPVVFYIFFPRLLATDTAGMETALFTFLTVGAFYWRSCGRKDAAIAAAALAAVTRPEGLLLVGLLMVVEGRTDVRRWVRYTLIAVGIVLPWIVFSYLYFGSPIPNAIGAKLALYSRLTTSTPPEQFAYLLGLHHPLGAVPLILSLLGGYWLLRRRRVGGAEMVWVVGLVLAYTFSRTHIFIWYPAPLYPIYLLFAGAALPLLLGQSRWRWRWPDRATGPLLAAITALLILANTRTVSGFRAYQQGYTDTVHAIGLYLKSEADPADVLAGEDIGYMGYYSGLRVIDRDGLVTPAAVPYNREGDYLGLILDCKPDWVVATPQGGMSAFLDTPDFNNHYQLKQSFKATPEPEYRLYIRKDKTRR